MESIHLMLLFLSCSIALLVAVCLELPSTIMNDYENRKLNMKLVIAYMSLVIVASSCFVFSIFCVKNSITPTIKDYLDGKVEMVIEKNIIVDSSGEELVKCDTTFKFKSNQL
jgi:nitrogen fixation/metabolism regulation signal transduction histidine kinase